MDARAWELVERLRDWLDAESPVTADAAKARSRFPLAHHETPGQGHTKQFGLSHQLRSIEGIRRGQQG